ncbi:hypothetical protein G5642_15160 [Citrobacter freundii]|nr:hypothetical protein [Citrobacter freundii]
MLTDKKNDGAKETVGVFGLIEKEPVIERIFKLVERYPSRNAAARAWKINENTLKNYYRRQENQPLPREHQLMKIAKGEGVSIEWLLTGKGIGPDDTEKTPKAPLNSHLSPNGDDDQLINMLSFLTAQERKQLTEVLARKGVETILCLLNETNLKLMRLDMTDKIKALEIITGKKGSSTVSEDVASPGPLSDSKKAG